MNIETIKKILQIGVFLTFLGHGTYAIRGNESWLVYLTTVGFSLAIAKQLIIVIGILDLIIAIIILIKPFKYIVIWTIIWAFSTALIRPISGESIFAFIERGSNWIAPLVLLLLINYTRKNEKS